MTSVQIDSLESMVKIPLDVPLAVSDLSEYLSSPPFVKVDGVFNARSLSSLPKSSTAVTPGLAYRSGTLENLSHKGNEDIKSLCIKTIFDLRSLIERQGFPAPNIDGIEVIWTPSTLDNPTTAQAQIHKKDDRVFSFVEMYTEMMQTHAAAFRVILKHIAAHPGDPFLFHCTAGKDRTGTLAFLLEDLAGSTTESMDIDYALTRIGIEPVRDFLTKKLLGGKELPEEKVREIMSMPKMRAYSQVPIDLMSQLKDAMEANWDGGVEGYVKTELGLTDEEVVKVKAVLRGEDS